MPDTLATLRTEVKDWLDDTLSDTRVNAAINDAVESLWNSLVQIAVSMFVQGPVSIHMNALEEGVRLVSIVDPTTGPTMDVVAADDVTLAIHSVQAAYTYVTESGTETLISPITDFTTPSVGSVASVLPPTIVQGAIGWNCYATSTPNTGLLVKQNEVPLPFTSPFNESDSGFAFDPNAPLPPAENTTGDDICYIKHLEAQMPDQGFKTYRGADIGSLLMERAGRSIAASSEYQTYYWDLVNQRQLEIRPALGTTWTPRYFYVKRPRRLRFDNAPLPFLTVPASMFLRCFALSLLSITVREFETAVAWEQKAEAERVRLQLLVAKMNAPKNEYITPFP